MTATASMPKYPTQFCNMPEAMFLVGEFACDGSVAAAATIHRGKGFTVIHSATGIWLVTFNKTFAQRYAITFGFQSAAAVNETISAQRVAPLDASSPGDGAGFGIKFLNEADTLVDPAAGSRLDFIAVMCTVKLPLK